MTKQQTCGIPEHCICGRCNNVIDINRKANEEAHKQSTETYERLLEFAKKLP